MNKHDIGAGIMLAGTLGIVGATTRVDFVPAIVILVSALMILHGTNMMDTNNNVDN